MENTSLALKIQAFLRILIQKKGGHKGNTMLNNTNGGYIGQGALMVEKGGVFEYYKRS